jgi:hypothetical protein
MLTPCLPQPCVRQTLKGDGVALEPTETTPAAAAAEQYVPGSGCDFGSLDDSSAEGGGAQGGAAHGGKSSGGGEAWSLLRNAWSVTQKLAKDVGVNDALKDVKLQVNKMKASQMGSSLQLIETVEVCVLRYPFGPIACESLSRTLEPIWHPNAHAQQCTCTRLRSPTDTYESSPNPNPDPSNLTPHP